MHVEMNKTPPAIDYTKSNVAVLEKLFNDPRAKEFWVKMNSFSIDSRWFCIIFCKSLGWSFHVKYAQSIISKAKKTEKLTLEIIETIDDEYKNNEIVKAGLDEILTESRNKIQAYKNRFDYVATKKNDIAASVYFCRNLAQFFELSTGRPCHELTAICASIVFEKEFFADSVSQTVNR